MTLASEPSLLIELVDLRATRTNSFDNVWFVEVGWHQPAVAKSRSGARSPVTQPRRCDRGGTRGRHRATCTTPPAARHRVRPWPQRRRVRVSTVVVRDLESVCCSTAADDVERRVGVGDGRRRNPSSERGEMAESRSGITGQISARRSDLTRERTRAECRQRDHDCRRLAASGSGRQCRRDRACSRRVGPLVQIGTPASRSAWMSRSTVRTLTSKWRARSGGDGPRRAGRGSSTSAWPVGAVHPAPLVSDPPVR
jgi:hypothetical protein